MASTKVEWGKATGDAWHGEGQIRNSKCGRYRIAKQMVMQMSSRNGCFHPEYTLYLLNPDGSVKCKFDGMMKAGEAREMAQDFADDPAEVTP